MPYLPGKSGSWEPRKLPESQNLLGVEHTPGSAAPRRRHRGAEDTRAYPGPDTDKNPGDHSGRVDPATGRQCRPTKRARGANQSGTQDRLGTGGTPGAWGGGTDGASLWHSRAGILVAEPCLPSGDAPWDLVEPCPT